MILLSYFKSLLGLFLIKKSLNSKMKYKSTSELKKRLSKKKNYID